jgi:hypothetical protein
MDLDQCFQAHENTALLVPGGGAGNNGQCAQWADTVMHDVYGLPCVYTPAALDWFNKFDELGLDANFEIITDGSIRKGDFVVWNPLSAKDPEGHIDVVSRDGGTIQDFYAYDSNWNATLFHDSLGYPTLHEVHHADLFNDLVVAIIRRKEDNMTIDDALARRLLSLSTLLAQPGTEPDRQPTTQEIKDSIGRDPVEYIDYLMSTVPYGVNWNKVKHYDEDLAAAQAQLPGGEPTILKPGTYKVQ